MGRETSTKLPEFFKPLFWSYNFEGIDPEKQKKLVIINSINYGNLKHWGWIKNYYGEETIRQILGSIPITELKPRAGKLAEIIFNFHPNYASRGAH